MSLSHPRSARAALALALAALLALPAALALAGPAPDAAPAAHAAKRRCAARGRAGARRCRRAARRHGAGSKVPPVGTTLTSADGKLELKVVAQRGGGRAVAVEWDMTATCPTGQAGAHLRTLAPVSGNSFTRDLDAAGVSQRFRGRFESVHQASGQAELSFPAGGGTCSTGAVAFTAHD